MTPEQYELNQERIAEHRHERYEVDMVVDEKLTLKDFVVCSNVLRPEKTSALYFARYLASEPRLYIDKMVMDMGCGSGIQGIVTGLLGASSVIFSDISLEAVDNTKENAVKFGLPDKSSVNRGDLFENIVEKVDLIIFNHPFFSADPLPDVPVTRAFFDSGELIQRFLTQAPSYLNPGGSIVMPYFEFAGDVNNPEVQARKYSYDITLLHQITVDDVNLQKGIFSVFELKPKVG
ncbi:MAG: class I SAM-dependent methyltransferase [Patescibacteria group bacterium]